jgi:hypothetical protein
MDGTAPRFLIRDRDDKYGPTFDRAAEVLGLASSRPQFGRRT